LLVSCTSNLVQLVGQLLQPTGLDLALPDTDDRQLDAGSSLAALTNLRVLTSWRASCLAIPPAEAAAPSTSCLPPGLQHADICHVLDLWVPHLMACTQLTKVYIVLDETCSSSSSFAAVLGLPQLQCLAWLIEVSVTFWQCPPH
jgi:hypothetical protein